MKINVEQINDKKILVDSLVDNLFAQKSINKIAKVKMKNINIFQKIIVFLKSWFITIVSIPFIVRRVWQTTKK